LIVEWARDSAFRFFPLIEHEELGATLHQFDLATNKVLALAGRLEVRDWVDFFAARSPSTARHPPRPSCRRAVLAEEAERECRLANLPRAADEDYLLLEGGRDRLGEVARQARSGLLSTLLMSKWECSPICSCG